MTYEAVCAALPVHCDLPVQLIGEGNPGDGTIVVVGVNTTEGHHAALLRVTTEESENLLINFLEIRCCLSICIYCPETYIYVPFSRLDTAKPWLSLRAQVHREEVLVDQALLHHVVEDGCSAGSGQAWVCQAQDAISTHVLHEGSLALAQAKDLVCHSKPTHL